MKQATVLKRQQKQRGVAAVEFSLVAVIFLMFVFGLLEVTRAMYVINVLQEVTRRAASAAAKTDFHDAAALLNVQAKAVFRDSPGPLLLADPVTDANVVIDYMSVSKGGDGSLTLKHIGALPSCPARNRMNCMSDPYADNCIRAVRVRVCASSDGAGNCTPVTYNTLFPLFGLAAPLTDLLTAPTIVPAGSLGYAVGSTPCS
jgi:hypothetical protein